MNKLFSVLILSILSAAVVFSVSAQTLKIYNAQSAHYLVYSEISSDQARTTANHLEKLFALFNSYFHFDESSLDSKLKVRMFSSKESYNEYLARIVSIRRDDFVYLHYTDSERSELLGFQREQKEFSESLAYHGFIQFIKSFVENPPLWLREGFAYYFKETAYSPAEDTVQMKENLYWLKYLKDMIKNEKKNNVLPLSTLITLDAKSLSTYSDAFYPQAWGLVSFLLNSDNKQFNRVLWDSISALQSSAGMEDNSINIKKRAFDWIDQEYFAKEMNKYLLSKKTFTDLITEGVSLYEEKKILDAENTFFEALNLREDNHIPYYYLGLIQYEKKNYFQAEYFYDTALQLGANPALTYYALGVNAYADKRYEDAETFLAKANNLNPQLYRDKVDELLKRIEAERE